MLPAWLVQHSPGTVKQGTRCSPATKRPVDLCHSVVQKGCARGFSHQTLRWQRESLAQAGDQRMCHEWL